MDDEIGDLDPGKLLEAGLSGGEEEEGLEPERLARAFPNLEFLEVLGRGGMGVVYRARQVSLDRVVAVKILPPGIGGDPAFAERFSREARALAKLDHPNIVRIHEAGESDGLFYLVMEHVDGVNLRQAMDGDGIAPAEALRIVPRICDALQYAHDRGIVHRDVKPENILIDREGRVKIADFGLAKIVGPPTADASLTGVEQVMGTLHYIAPEQIRTPKDVDHRADVYSLGVVFYEMLTGDLPIGRFPKPSEKVEVDVRLDEVVLRTLERERERRYQRVSELKTGVESVVSGAGAEPPSRDEARPVPPDGGRTSGLAIAGILGIPAALVTWVLVVALGARDEHATLAAAAIAVTGVLLSVVARREIRRSGGRLRGGRLATAGIVLPPLLAGLLVLLGLVAYFRFYGPERDRIREEVGHVATEVEIRDRVEGWLADLARRGPAVAPADLEELVAPSLRAELARLGPQAFLEEHGPDAGLPFLPPAEWPAPIFDFRFGEAGIDGDRATVEIIHRNGSIRFPMVREEGEWWFGPGPVEVVPR